MDWQRTEAVVLRRRPVTESSLIVTWLSREFGLLRTMAKGARRLKGPFAGKIDLFYEDEILFLPSRRGDLHLLHDCFVVDARPRLRESVPRLTAAACAAEAVELIAPVEDPQPRMFDALRQVLDSLNAGRGDPAVLGLWLEARLLDLAGWRLEAPAGAAVGGILRGLLSAGGPGAVRLRLTAAQRGLLRGAIWSHWDAHVGQAPRSRAALARLFPTTG